MKTRQKYPLTIGSQVVKVKNPVPDATVATDTLDNILQYIVDYAGAKEIMGEVAKNMGVIEESDTEFYPVVQVGYLTVDTDIYNLTPIDVIKLIFNGTLE